MRQRRYPIRAKEARKILDEASRTLKLDLEALFDPKVNVEVVESDVGEIYLFSGNPLLFRADKRVLPTLLFAEYIEKAPKIVVDMGAVPYVCKGADVMAPGIVRVEGEFCVSDLVVIIDVKFGKALALGWSLVDAQTAKSTRKGPVVETVHYVSDKVWDYIKTLVDQV
jgi:PUA-domain protein